MRSLTKTKQDNDMTNRTSAIYAENETELPWPIELSVVYEENQTEQGHDRLYSYGLF